MIRLKMYSFRERLELVASLGVEFKDDRDLKYMMDKKKYAKD